MCLVEQVHERIHASMEAHEDSPLLHEVSLEALSILCAAGARGQILKILMQTF